MKLAVILLATPSLVASWAVSGSSSTQQAIAGDVSAADVTGCVSHAEKFLTKSQTNDRAIQQAMDHCAIDKQIEDKNFVCPHYKEFLVAAFRRESTTKKFSANTFCDVTEVYAAELGGAAKVPNMGNGTGFGFVLSKDCKPAVLSNFAKGEKKLPAKSAPDFWYAMCMNQHCAHFLPSRTRWCKQDHQPTHSQSVCEAVRIFAHDEAFLMEKNLNQDLDADQVCNIYEEFVEYTHINVEAYMHVVHGTKEHPVPSPENQKRALDSAKMKNEAGKNKLIDSHGEPVKSGAMSANLLWALLGLAGLCLC